MRKPSSKTWLRSPGELRQTRRLRSGPLRGLLADPDSTSNKSAQTSTKWAGLRLGCNGRLVTWGLHRAFGGELRFLRCSLLHRVANRRHSFKVSPVYSKHKIALTC